LTSKNGAGNDRRTALRAELDTLRAKQTSGKTSRTKLFEQVKIIQEGVEKKVCHIILYFISIIRAFPLQRKELAAAKAKAPFKSVAEVDAQIM
jgi:hypothetical protein